MIRSTFRVQLLCTSACILAPWAIHPAAAKPPKVPSTNSSAAKTAPKASSPALAPTRMRLWKASDVSTAGMQVQLVPEAAGGTKPTTLPVDTQSLQFTNYLTVPPGASTIEVTLPGHPPVRLPVNLAAGSDSTLLVQGRSGQVRARWIDDTPAAEESGTNFNVYNLLPSNGGDVQVMLGDVVNVHLALPGGSSRTGGLKAAVYPVTASGIDSDGKSFRWNTETDLKNNRRATLLIYPDPYGRIRPRLVEDGPSTNASPR